VLSAVRKELRRIQSGLATGTLGPRPDSQIGSALGAVVDNYLRSWWVGRGGAFWVMLPFKGMGTMT
jgi:hypothetical protein